MATYKKLIYLPLEGVESNHSALIVENNLNKLEGIELSKVDLNKSRVLIQVKNHEVIAKALIAINKLGYNVTTILKTFSVLKMSCASCAISIENILRSTSGVVNVNVNYAAANATIEYIPSLINTENIQKAVQSIGYDLLTNETSSNNEILELFQQEKFSQLKKNTFGAIVLSAPIVFIGMFFKNMLYANEIMWIISTIVILWFGRGFFINAWKQSKRRSANMDTLVALSTGVAYTFSVFNTLFPHFWQNRGMHAHVYFEAATVIIAFILLGKFLEEKAKSKTSSAIKKLMDLQPKTVTIVQKGRYQTQIPIEQVRVGNTIFIKPGEKIAVDGTIIKGNSYIDESMMSGESIPIQKKKNDKVYAGTINQKGSFFFKVEKVGNNTMLAQIIKMVQDAQGSKAPIQKLVDKVAGIFVPVVLIISIISFIAWNILGENNSFTYGLLALITVLVIACPCALGLATPTAIMVGVGKGAEKGILIKDAESLELAKKINAIVLDKTGTITEGKTSISNEIWYDDHPTFKQILLSIEKQSEHPLAEAIVKHFYDINLISISEFESITGKGVMAKYDGETYFIGNIKLIQEHNIPIDNSISNKVIKWENEAKTVIWFANSKKIISILAITDQIKPTSKTAIQKLQKSGIEVYMLTGDNETIAEIIAKKLGIQQFKAKVLPEQKALFVKELQAMGKIIGMVGDGINDSTALAQADVSFAMGKGSDIAKDIAKMTIISSDLNKIPESIRLSKITVRTIHQNLFWAFIYNLISIPIAAGILYPINGFLLNPMIASAAMVLSSLSVVSNSLRLKWRT